MELAESQEPRAGTPKVGISACLLGQRVRYDGGHKLNVTVTDVLGKLVEWVPVCPEVELGLGTPREPIQLVRIGGGIRLVTVESRIDYTHAMNEWARVRLDDLAKADLSGYVLKSKSPSCGLDSANVYDGDWALDAKGRGLFAAALVDRFPGLPVEEEDRLQDPAVRGRFIERVLAYRAS